MQQTQAQRWPKLTTSFPPSLMRRLRKATAAKNITSSDLVRDAVRRYVDGLLDADKEDNAQQRQRD